MAGMTEKDVSEVKSMINKIVQNAINDGRQIKEILKLTSQDKDMAKLSKAMDEAHPVYHKAARAMLDAINDAMKKK